MTDGDHLDKERSITFKANASGFEAKTNSRLVSGADRFFGNLTEYFNVSLEKKISSKREATKAKDLVVRAAAEKLAADVREDSDLAFQILQPEFAKMARHRDNKERVFGAALDELRLNPPSSDEANSGPDQLSDGFLNRFERYAEDASEEEVRAKWAKVLAAEIRSPGHFDAKVMRTLDEIDNETATWFSELVKHAIGPSIPKSLYHPDYKVSAALQEAGLISDTFPGVIRFGQTLHLDSNEKRSAVVFDKYVFYFTGLIFKDAINNLKQPDLIRWDDEKKQIALPIVALTATGASILGILEDYSIENARKLLTKLKVLDSGVKLYLKSEYPSEIREII